MGFPPGEEVTGHWWSALFNKAASQISVEHCKVCVCVCAHTCTRVHACACACVCVHVHGIHVHMHVYVCICEKENERYMYVNSLHCFFVYVIIVRSR